LATYPSSRGILSGLTNPSCKKIGMIGELWLADKLRNQGYLVAMGIQGQKKGDLSATDPRSGELIRIEVKTARRGKNGKWKFTLVKTGCTDHRHADVVALLAVMDSGRVVTFIVPVEALAKQRQAVISSHPERYKGKLAQWRKRDLFLC